MNRLPERRSSGILTALLGLVFLVQACQGPPAETTETIEVINWNTYHLFDHRA